MAISDELIAEINQRCRLKGHFVLRSGQTSNVYFDKYQFEADPRLLLAVSSELQPLIPSGTEVLAGLELGGVPIAACLSQLTGLPLALVRKQRKTYGTERLAEGTSVSGRRVLLVEDVVTSGGQVAISGEDLRSDGAIVEHAVCVIDREAGGADLLRESGISMQALIVKSDLDRAEDAAKS